MESSRSRRVDGRRRRGWYGLSCPDPGPDPVVRTTRVVAVASFVEQSYPSAGMERKVEAGKEEPEGSSRSPRLVVSSSL